MWAKVAPRKATLPECCAENSRVATLPRVGNNERTSLCRHPPPGSSCPPPLSSSPLLSLLCAERQARDVLKMASSRNAKKIKAPSMGMQRRQGASNPSQKNTFSRKRNSTQPKTHYYVSKLNMWWGSDAIYFLLYCHTLENCVVSAAI